MSKKGKIIIFLAVIIAIIIIVFVIVYKKPGKLIDPEYGKLPDTISQENIPEGYVYDNTIGDFVPNKVFIYPEDVVYQEETISGGSMPNIYLDKEENTYKREYSQALGYSMFIPDGFKKVADTSGYLQNTYYLKDTGSKKNENIQISVSTKTNIGEMSFDEIFSLFEPVKNNLSYSYMNIEFNSSLYEMGNIKRVTTYGVGGFDEEIIDENSTIVYCEELPRFTMQSKKYPDNTCDPYVVFYYIIKKDVAVMISVIGPKIDAVQMTYLSGTMALNIRELLNDNATAVKFNKDFECKADNISADIDSSWNKRYVDSYCFITPSEDQSSFLYGNQITIGSNEILPEKGLSDFLSMKNIQFALKKSYFGFPMTFSGQDYECVNDYYTYSDDNVSDVYIGGYHYIRIEYKYIADEYSLRRNFNFIENPVFNTIYLYNNNGNVSFVNFKYLSNNKSYMEQFEYEFMSNVKHYE